MKKKLVWLKKINRTRAVLISSLILFISSGLIFFFSFNPPDFSNELSFLLQAKNKLSFFNERYPEIDYLKDKTLNFDQLKSFFQDLAKKKGAVYAYDVLKQAPMPPNTDMHLLGHVVGEILYLQKGAEGIKYCTPDFRNACSHTIVVGLFLDKGEAALKEINEACKKAPGGTGAYIMCHHGLGHGVLSFTGYDLKKTVELCKKTGTSERKFEEYPECVGGAVMEQISGGDHDRKTWQEQRKVNLKASDPLYPCNSDIIPDESAKKLCFIYLTPHLFGLGGENPRNRPTTQAIIKAFTFCDQIPKQDKANRDVCFGGFGKEFVVLARDRDIRNVDNMPTHQLRQALAWCLLTPDQEGQKSCIKFSVGSLFWGGENKRTAAVNFCNITTTHQYDCFRSLTNSIKRFVQDKSYRQEYCNEVPDNSKEYCQKTLL